MKREQNGTDLGERQVVCTRKQGGQGRFPMALQGTPPAAHRNSTRSTAELAGLLMRLDTRANGSDGSAKIELAVNYREHIERDPHVVGGEPVLKGTRVTLRTVLASLAEGATTAEILADFPTL